MKRNGYSFSVFDIRLYVLVTSYIPLKVYLFKEGLVRLATVPFKGADFGENFAHLTNYCINRENKNVFKKYMVLREAILLQSFEKDL